MIPARLGCFRWETHAARADGFPMNEAEELFGKRSTQGRIGGRPGVVVVVGIGVIGENEKRGLGPLQPLAQGRSRRQIGGFAQVESRQQSRPGDNWRFLSFELFVKLVANVGGRAELKMNVE